MVPWEQHTKHPDAWRALGRGDVVGVYSFCTYGRRNQGLMYAAAAFTFSLFLLSLQAADGGAVTNVPSVVKPNRRACAPRGEERQSQQPFRQSQQSRCVCQAQHVRVQSEKLTILLHILYSDHKLAQTTKRNFLLQSPITEDKTARSQALCNFLQHMRAFQKVECQKEVLNY